MIKDTLFAELLAELNASWQQVPDKPEENPYSTMQALWLSVCGIPRTIQMTRGTELPFLDETQASRVRELVGKRIAGVPLAYITGRQDFMGLELIAGPEAVIPRKETEILGNAALVKLKELVRHRGGAKVIDLCTGSGNLALAFATYESHCTIVGGDLSSDAIGLAERNSEKLGLASRVRFIQGDLFAPFESEDYLANTDLVVCNPPYISSAKVALFPHEISDFEPRIAFDGGLFGVKILTRLVQEAHRFLKPESWLCFEVGLGQGSPLAQMLKSNPHYQLVESYTDERGEIRALLART